MTSLKKILAFNMKDRRRVLGISQAALAERVHMSTHYIAMIELERKAPSLLMMERIATALQIDPPELFSMRSVPSDTIKKLQETVLTDLEKAVSQVITGHLKKLEKIPAEGARRESPQKKRPPREPYQYPPLLYVAEPGAEGEE